MTIDNNFKFAQKISECREHCKCGHVVYMPARTPKCVCNYCGRSIQNNSRARFKYMLLQQGIVAKEVRA